MLAAAPRLYQPRDATKSTLHRVIERNLDAFLESARDPEDPASGVPSFVERELRAFLECGRLERGFVRLRCAACGLDQLLAFSCKSRSLCPSCGARRMADTAAHLVDRVLPDCALRQWVLTAPFELRALLSARADFLQAMDRAFVGAVFRNLTARTCQPDGKSGAVTLVQRFGSSLNCNPHLHVLVLDGVYTWPAGAAQPSFHPAPPPTSQDELSVSLRVAHAMKRWLVRRGLLDPIGGADGPRTPIERWYASAFGDPQRLSRVDEHGGVGRGWAPLPRPADTSTGVAAGFSVHARVFVRAGDRAGRERLVRYAARPPLADAQISETADGRIAFRLTKPRRNGDTHLVLEPLRFIRRLAWLVAPPRFHLVRFHGVLSSAATWRAEVVPSPPVEPSPRGSLDGREMPEPEDPRTTARRQRWAALLRRVYDVDGQLCPRCGGRLAPVSVIDDPAVVRRILDHLGHPSTTAEQLRLALGRGPGPPLAGA